MSYKTANFASTIDKLIKAKSEFIEAEGPIKPLSFDRTPVHPRVFADAGYPRSAVLAGIMNNYNLNLSSAKVSEGFNFFRKSFNGDIEIGFNDGTKIVEQGNKIRTSQPTTLPNEERAFLVVSIAKQKGWQGMTCTGTDDYVLTVWLECMKQGLTVKPKPDQARLFARFMNQMNPSTSQLSEETRQEQTNNLYKPMKNKGI